MINLKYLSNIFKFKPNLIEYKNTLSASYSIFSKSIMSNANEESLVETKTIDNSAVEKPQPPISKHQQKKLTRREMKEERKRALKQRRQLKNENKGVGYSNVLLNQTSYYFENGLRKVYPYFFGWNTTAKERWFNRTLLDIYTKEFNRSIVNQSIQNLIETGKIRINGQIRPLTYKVKNGDRISHVKHRHEIPVLDDEIKIVYEDENFLAVNKPCSIPMHPCGKYRYNSLGVILTKEYGFSNLRTQYRLDRLTSGLVVMGKNFKSSQIIDSHIKNRTAEKKYVCRVIGEFPKERIKVDKAIDCASKKIGLFWLDDKNGKEAITEFERLSYNGETSVVLCYPKTGRTHQIRIHLQYLGYPIVNDPLYNQPTVWGESNGKNGVYEYSKEKIEQNFLNIHTYEAWIIKQEQIEQEKEEDKNNDEDDDKTNENKANNDEKTTNSPKKCNDDVEEISNNKRKEGGNEIEEEIVLKKQKVENEELIEEENESNDSDKNEKLENNIKPNRPGFDPKLIEKDPDCFECKQVYRDPQRKDLIMYLHALTYKFGDLQFKTEMPYWAEADFKGEE